MSGIRSSDLLDSARTKMDRAKKKLEDLCKRIPSKEALIYGYLASTEKRQAEILFQTFREESNRLLVHARDHYWNSFVRDRAYHWAVVQYLSLDLLIRSNPDMYQQWAVMPSDGSESRQEKDPAALWTLARLLSLYDLNAKNREVRSWAHGNLIELYLLSLVLDVRTVTAKEATRRALEHADQLIDISGDSFEVYSTRRQMLRYLEWYSHLWGVDPKAGAITGLAEKIFNKFPEDIEDKW